MNAEEIRNSSSIAPSPNELDLRDLQQSTTGSDERTRRQAASRLLARYQDHVFEWCNRYARDRDEAMDLTQEVLLSAFRNLNQFVPRAKFSTWLFMIARNRCLTEMRKVPLRQVLDLDLEQFVAGTDDPSADLEREEERERVQSLIREHLDPQEQEAIVLRCFERMPVDGITELLDIKEASGARGVLQRARRKLRAALLETGGG